MCVSCTLFGNSDVAQSKRWSDNQFAISVSKGNFLPAVTIYVPGVSVILARPVGFRGSFVCI